MPTTRIKQMIGRFPIRPYCCNQDYRSRRRDRIYVNTSEHDLYTPILSIGKVRLNQGAVIKAKHAMGDAITTLSHMVHFVAGDGKERVEAGCGGVRGRGRGEGTPHDLVLALLLLLLTHHDAFDNGALLGREMR